MTFSPGDGGWNTSGGVTTQPGNVNGPIAPIISLFSPVPAPPLGPRDGDNVVASMTLDVTIPAEVTTLAFDYAIPQTSAGH